MAGGGYGFGVIEREGATGYGAAITLCGGQRTVVYHRCGTEHALTSDSFPLQQPYDVAEHMHDTLTLRHAAWRDRSTCYILDMPRVGVPLVWYSTLIASRS